MDSKKKFIIDEKTGQTTYEFSEESKYAEKCFLSNDLKWPNAGDMKLDDSQYSAIKLALENKLALIQGPPGTGKTFIGVKIVELLIHNKHLWWNKPNDQHRPILMICYTNHALDQFLEYCIDECGLNMGIVRVGGRCKSTKLNPFLLSTIKTGLKMERKIDFRVHQRIRDQFVAIEAKQKQIKDLVSLISHVEYSGIVTPKLLIENSIIESAINDQFEAKNKAMDGLLNRKSVDYTLLEWLGIFNIDSYANANAKETNDLVENMQNLSLNEQDDESTCVRDRRANNSDDEAFSSDEEMSSDEESSSSGDESKSIDKNEDASYFEDENMLLNGERMLEDDYMINQKTTHKDSTFPESRRYKVSKYFDFLINEEEINEMCIEFNNLRGSSYLMQMANQYSSKWQVKGGHKQRKLKHKSHKTRTAESLINEFVANSLNYLLDRSNDAELPNDLPNEIADIWDLGYEERVVYYRVWLNQFVRINLDKLKTFYNEFSILTAQLKELRLQEDMSIMKGY